MSRTDPQFKLRMPAALRAQVERSAWAARRSLNAEIVLRLEASFGPAAQCMQEASNDREVISALSKCVASLDQLLPYLGKVPADVGLLNDALVAARAVLAKQEVGQ